MDAAESDMVGINLAHRDTEAGWLKIADRFYLAATPKWFEWLNWVLVLAAFQYLATATGLTAFRLIPAISTLLLWQYFNAFFARMYITVGRNAESGIGRVLRVTVSGVVAFGFFAVAYSLAHALAQNGDT